MEKDDNILSIDRMDKGVSVHFSPKSDKDIFAVALTMFNLSKSCPEVFDEFIKISYIAEKDENFKNLIDNSIIDLPDFNQILKN